MTHDTSLSALIAAIDDAERGPGPGDLDGAPDLLWWRLVAEGVALRAAGLVRGHPLIDDPWIETSPVLGYDRDAGWMRTRSRWYRLGDPADPDHIAALDPAAQRLLAALRRRVRPREWRRGETA